MILNIFFTKLMNFRWYISLISNTIHFNTEALSTLKNLPIERKPRPSRYKCKACFFSD